MKWKLYSVHCRKCKERNKQRPWKGIEGKKGNNKVMKKECYRIELKPSKPKSWHEVNRHWL